MQLINSNFSNISREIQDKYYFISTIGKLDKNLMFVKSKYYQQFINSWNNLCFDDYMSDGGKYRYRRYNVVNYYISTDCFKFLPNEPHFQKETYNSLNGGVYREYKPFEDKILENPILKKLIKCCSNIFNLIETQYDWRVECHQFRINPTVEFCGLPTPEGKHRDGVDYVFIMLINKVNILGGTTGIYNTAGDLLISYTLEQPFEYILLDDTKVMHDVSPVQVKNIDNTAYRDILVLTFQKII